MNTKSFNYDAMLIHMESNGSFRFIINPKYVKHNR